MSFDTLINPALSTLLKGDVIAEVLVEKAGEKALSIFQTHFTFSAFEMANSYQKSYAYALAADLIIDKPLEIIGDGEVADIVVESKNSRCIFMKTDHALVRGLSLHNRAKECYAVDIPQGQLTLEYCDITSDTLSCICIHGSEAEGIVSHCQIHASKACGVAVLENGTGLLYNCDIFGNASVGIAIKTGDNPVVQRCQIHDNNAGVLVLENGTGQIENCDIFGNALNGIEIKGGNPVVQKCTIKQNAYRAVYVHDGGAGTIENCDLRDNAKGAWNIESGCQVRRSGNKEEYSFNEPV